MIDEFKLLQKDLLNSVSEKVRQYGFDKRKGQSFYKICPFGRETFHLSFITHDDDFDITGDVAIRFDEVEKMVNPDNKETHTLGAELGNVSEGKQRRWTIARKSDVSVVTNSIVNAFLTIGLPYFDKYSNRSTVLEVLSQDTPDSWLHAPIHSDRAKSAVCLSLLLQGKEEAQALAKKKLSYLEKRNDFGISSFRTFLKNNIIDVTL